MTVYMLWHGGINYAVPQLDQRTEHPGLIAAREAFESMTSADSYYPGAYVDAPQEERPSAHVFLYDPAGDDVTDAYPDHLLEWSDAGEAVLRPFG